MLPAVVGRAIDAAKPWVLLAGIVLVYVKAFEWFLLPRVKGLLGETLVNFLVKLLLNWKRYLLIRDVILPTPDGPAQIDHVIVSSCGVFVIETQAYKGRIYGGEDDAEWTQVGLRRKKRFRNPLRVSCNHARILSQLTGIPERYLKPVVVFVGNCTFRTPMPTNVVHTGALVPYIKSHKVPIIKDRQVPEIVTAIEAWAAVTDQYERIREER